MYTYTDEMAADLQKNDCRQRKIIVFERTDSPLLLLKAAVMTSILQLGIYPENSAAYSVAFLDTKDAR